MLLGARGHLGRLRAHDARDADRAGRGDRSRSDLPHLERRASAPSATCTRTTTSYEAVLGGIDSPALIVSTKYTLGDFYSWLPLNVTLEQGQQRRIVEFQSRREFENFGAFPNDLGPEYQFALQKLLAANPNIEGVWTWTQDGGPWRAGPMTLYLKAGFWQLYELNTMLAADLARDPDADVGRVTEDWAREWFSDDPATVAAIVQAMALSRAAIEQGMYIQPFAEQRVFAIGLEPPPMMWIFEWDILTGDSAVLDVHLRDLTRRDRRRHRAGDRGRRAGASRRRDACATSWRRRMPRPGTTRRPATAFLGTLDYEVDVLRLLVVVPRDDPASGAVARHRCRPTRTRRGRPTATRSRRSPRPPRAVRRRHRLPGVQPHRRRTRRAARRPRPGDGLDRAGAARARGARGSSSACSPHAPGSSAARAPRPRARRGSARRGRGARASPRSDCCPSTGGCCSASRRPCWWRPGRCRPRSCRGRTWRSSSGRGSSSSLVVRLLRRVAARRGR